MSKKKKEVNGVDGEQVVKTKKPKKVLTPEQKKKRCKKAWTIVGIIVLALMLLVGVCATITQVGLRSLSILVKEFDRVEYDNQLTPTKTADGHWTFYTDKDFRVMQLTDIHIGAGYMSQKQDKMALNAVAAMITAEKPDLVIVTGDIAYPVPVQAGTFNNLNAAKLFADLMEELGVYWTFSYGNHDTEAYSMYTREDISEWYTKKNYKFCLYQPGPTNIDGKGNQIIKVMNSSGLVSQALVVLDSHSYLGSDPLGIKWDYDNIHANQIEWYKSEILRLNAFNNKVLGTLNAGEGGINAGDFTTVKSLAFFHIPLREYRVAWNEYVNNGYKNTADTKYVYGVAKEKGDVVYCGANDDELFETMLELGSTKGIFTGHDHLNNFSLTYKGIRLTYGMSVDYLAYPGIYKRGSHRGCTVITVDKQGDFDCTANSYYQDKYKPLKEKEKVTFDAD